MTGVSHEVCTDIPWRRGRGEGEGGGGRQARPSVPFMLTRHSLQLSQLLQLHLRARETDTGLGQLIFIILGAVFGVVFNDKPVIR